MTVKEHYDNHLGNFYSWFTGDFMENKDRFKRFCKDNTIVPFNSKNAIDLGAGNGIQSIALAELGFNVKAIDFNTQLIAELKANVNGRSIDVVNRDIRSFRNYCNEKAELVVCCGDTLLHLQSVDEIKQLLSEIAEILEPKGKVVLTFRDYSVALQDTNRFIPVKSDSQRILTCFIEYFPDKLRVTDLLYELEGGRWIQKVSSYYKTRVTQENVVELLGESGLEIVLAKKENGMISIVARK